ncbi:hypothetical protein EV421DRAFT_1980957 [Armillaria borealis]|uniref:Uncharacterized protein n=1 Tax=Armillaria borealis TaxID=47425 RepID=A0AA39J916_9AGAR|nr:hypothetical protein EV421DRAFT_1980957 [Armillaria borealis]
MAAQAALPPDLTSDDIHVIFEILDVNLNTIILQALLHGFYTGVLGVTLWSVFRRSIKNLSMGRYAMILIIFVLYILATISLGKFWEYAHHAFIDEGQNCYTVFVELDGFSSMSIQENLTVSITACLSTFIADTSLIWRCWVVWGHRWLIIIIPVLCTILSTVFKSIETYHVCFDITTDIEHSTYAGTIAEWKMSYLALTVTTTLWCTVFILYHIINVAGSSHGAGIHSYHRVIEALVESAALYSTIMIIDIVFVAHNSSSGNYVDFLATAIWGIMPTLLVGRVAAGHARPDDSWQESSTFTVSSLNFGTESFSIEEGDVTQGTELDEMDNLDPGLKRNSALIEEVAQEARSLDIV